MQISLTNQKEGIRTLDFDKDQKNEIETLILDTCIPDTLHSTEYS